MDILDILLDDDAKPVKVEAVDTNESDMDLLLEEFSTGDTEAKKASLRAMLRLLK